MSAFRQVRTLGRQFLGRRRLQTRYPHSRGWDQRLGDDNEAGRIGLLLLVTVLIVASLVGIGISVTAIQVQKMRLLTCADAVAAAAAQSVNAPSFYVSGEVGVLEIDQDAAKVRAADFLTSVTSATCRVGMGARLGSVELSGDDIVVTLRALAKVPLMPGIVGEVVAPELVVTSSARLQ